MTLQRRTVEPARVGKFTNRWDGDVLFVAVSGKNWRFLPVGTLHE